MAGYYDRDRNTRTLYGHNADGQNVSGQMNHAVPSHNNTAEYQSSGIPFVYTCTISENNTTVHVINFPYVTRWVMVQCLQDAAPTSLEPGCRIGFGNTGSQSEGIDDTLYVNSSLTNQERLEIKCTNVQIMAKANALTDSTNKARVQVIAGLTGVPARDFPNLDGTADVLSGITSDSNNGSATFAIKSTTTLS